MDKQTPRQHGVPVSYKLLRIPPGMHDPPSSSPLIPYVNKNGNNVVTRKSLLDNEVSPCPQAGYATSTSVLNLSLYS